MTATKSLMRRAEAMTDEVERKIRDDGGQIVGTITEIRRHLGLSCFNNELREALGLLVKAERLSGAPIYSLSLARNTPLVTYRYVVLVPVYHA